MDFTKRKTTSRIQVMKEGDLVIVYERHDSMDHFYLRHGGQFNNKFGVFSHDEMIGKPFGSRIKSRTSTGYIYVLEPTPELWSSAVHSRTQIVNETDASVCTLMLDLYPGCTVVESGTGSGCMTLSLARAVAPNGHVFTYEYNKHRAQTAAEEFKKLKVDDLITVTHRDICGKYVEGEDVGFAGRPDCSADAIFLDVPEPWLALDEARRVLKPGRSMCCYSPCVEQVMKTCEKLRALGFQAIRTIEARSKPYDARVTESETLDMGLTPEEEEVNARSVRDPNSQHQVYIEKEDVDVTAAAAVAAIYKKQGDEEFLKSEAYEPPAKRTKDESGEDVVVETTTDASPEEIAAVAAAKLIANDESNPIDVRVTAALKAAELRMLNRLRNRPRPSVNGKYISHVARPMTQMKSHTAFLTFAVLPDI